MHFSLTGSPPKHSTLSQKMSQVSLAVTLIHINQFLFLAHVASRHSTIGDMCSFLNYLILLNLCCSEAAVAEMTSTIVTTS